MMQIWEPSGHVDVQEMLEVLDIENIRPEGHDEVRFSCPFPGHENGDRSASAYMNKDSTAWMCQGCKRKGNATSFSASMLQISPMKAKRLLRQAYDPSSLDPDQRNMVDELREFFGKSKRQESSDNEVFDRSLIERFDVDWQAVAEADPSAVPDSLAYMMKRGFGWETLAHWGFGLDERTDRITFPVYNEHCGLVGVKARSTTNRHPKYLMLGDGPDKDYYGFPRFAAGHVVFGMHNAIEGGHSDLIVCEGELNAVALWQMGCPNAVALNGSKLTSRQARIIRRHADSVTFFFDPDRAGLAGMWGWEDEDGFHHKGALETLARDMQVRVVGPFDEDPADALKNGNQAEIRRLLADAENFVRAALHFMAR